MFQYVTRNNFDKQTSYSVASLNEINKNTNVFRYFLQNIFKKNKLNMQIR